MSSPESARYLGGDPALGSRFLFEVDGVEIGLFASVAGLEVSSRFVEVAEGGHLRINAQRCLKPAHGLAVGDVLTFPQGRRIRLIRVLSLSDRRGPAAEAVALYEDLDPPGQDAMAEPLE